MRKPFSKQVIIVTGASRGIGRATAVAFAAAGGRVVINYHRNESAARATLDQITQNGGIAILVQANVAEPEDCDRLVKTAVSLGRLKVLVNNAAAFSRDHFFDTDLEEFDRVFHTNVRALFYLSRLAGAEIATNGGGSIIHISSILARLAVPTRTLYCSSKGAVESLTRAMALDLAPHNVRVNAVAPGLVETEALRAGFPTLELLADVEAHIPMQRFGEPQEVAEVITFLASPAAGYVNGVTLLVDGGLGAREAGPLFSTQKAQ